MIKALLIDIDNTILDFDAYVREGMKSGFQKFGLPPYEDYMYGVFWDINSKMWRGIEDGTFTYEELLKTRWNTVFAALGFSFDGVMFEKYFKGCLFDSAIPIDGAYGLLDYLKARYPLYVASNGAYAQQINRLTKSNMMGNFKGLFISEKVGASKPAPEFFEHCIKEISGDLGEDLHPTELMIIGDSLSSDIRGAIDLGIKTCYFDRYAKGDGAELPITHRVTSLSEIKDFL